MTAKDDRRSDEWWDEGTSGDDDVRGESREAPMVGVQDASKGKTLGGSA
jgi:hypothetical protein